ncbi:hypothetical protein [Maricaulis sp.]|uniref:hypothetical protein n=1 Tax=Maricaulis sp. TaxID=1486257 RepID=UPI00262116BC|nr:hypothetical protein [Maricaulis sp.]
MLITSLLATALFDGAGTPLPSCDEVEPARLVAVGPALPRRWNEGLELPLEIDAGFDIDAEGQVTNIQLPDNPAHLTEAINAALEKWRYMPGNACTGARTRFGFDLTD